MRNKVIIGLGANLGEPKAQMRSALKEIERRGLGRVVARSHLYRTEPVGFADQEWFINAAAVLETELDLRELMAGLLELEHEAGRMREASFKNGPRVLDLDILFAGDTIIDEGGLVIPHPRAHERRFVMAPVAELAPDCQHPVLSKSMAEILKELKDPAAAKRQDELL